MSILGNPICMPIGGKAAKGSQMFLAVSLPRSLYYTQAAEWLKIKDNPKAVVNEAGWDGQVVCGNALWELHDNHAYAYSLENGELLEDVVLNGVYSSPHNAICTDGINRIWFLRISYPTTRNLSSEPNERYKDYFFPAVTLTQTLFEFNIDTKSVSELVKVPFALPRLDFARKYSNAIIDSSSSEINKTVHTLIGYSSISNCIYYTYFYYSFRASGRYGDNGSYDQSKSVNSTIPSLYFYAFNLTTLSNTQLAAFPRNNMYSGCFFYDDGDFLYTGNGYKNADKEKAIYRYNKQSDTWETITTTFEGFANGPFSYVQIGNKMLQISQTATGIFDPKTGNLESLSTPVVPPDNMVMYPGFKAFGNNILYLITNQGVYKCPFFSKVPEDAPIVCKIYKGQKYHTLEPFEIPNKLKLLRTQQVADKDYEIKMYEYSSEGGQTIYIEDVNEK